ncbi:MAG: hypothetical protein OIF57_04675 [Marinobacterium sp.]|nr:hypothetical protein [Marinobacterium sp.]
MITYQLTRPLSYLLIKHDDKWLYDWLIPLLLTAGTLWLSVEFIPMHALINKGGLISDITGFVANLPGFFIAALAAVATFNKNDIDQLMDNPPKISVMHHGKSLMVDMTRRRFLCVLFAYLTATSIMIVLLTKLFLAVELTTEYKVYFNWAGVGFYFFMLWQMVIATILGLYYLGERLHTPQR